MQAGYFSKNQTFATSVFKKAPAGDQHYNDTSQDQMYLSKYTLQIQLPPSSAADDRSYNKSIYLSPGYQNAFIKWAKPEMKQSRHNSQHLRHSRKLDSK